MKDEIRDIVIGRNAIRWFDWNEEEPKKNVAWRWKMCWNRKSPVDGQWTNGVVTAQDFADVEFYSDGQGVCPKAYMKEWYDFWENSGNGWKWVDYEDYLDNWNTNGKWSLLPKSWGQDILGGRYWGFTHYGNEFRFADVRQHYMERYPDLDWNRDAAPAPGVRKEKIRGPDQSTHCTGPQEFKEPEKK